MFAENVGNLAYEQLAYCGTSKNVSAFSSEDFRLTEI